MNRFKKKMLAGGLASVMLLSSNSLILAESMGNFTQVNTYQNGTFKDVPSSAWYHNDVREAYKLDLMKGLGSGKFSPRGNVTLAEAITLATKIHATYNNNQIDTKTNTNKWYDPYVAYAKENNIINNNFSNYSKNINRSELVHILSNSLLVKELNSINDIKKLPDVNDNTSYSDSIFKLYNAGIIRGTGDMGTFKPQTNISRAETAAMINRLVNKSNRLKFVLSESEDITNNIEIKRNIKSILDDVFGYYLPRFKEGELDEVEVLDAYGLSSISEFGHIDDYDINMLFEDGGINTDIYSISRVSKNTMDNFTLKYFGKKLNHENHRSLYIENQYKDWARLYENNNYYYAFLPSDAYFILENHRIENIKRLSNGDIKVKATSYFIEMGEEETREDVLVQKSISQGYHSNLVITFRQEGSNFIIKEVIDLGN